MIEAGSVQVVDIRDSVSFQTGHIDGAVSINHANLQSFLDQTDRNLPLIVCCYHGVMSVDAAAFFRQQGFESVFSLDGGYSQWEQSAGEVT